MHTIIWLVKQLFIKLGWLKASEAGDECRLPESKVNYSQEWQRNKQPAGCSPFDVFFR